MKFGLFAALIVLTSSIGCSPRLLPNSNVEDTPSNRAIGQFLEQYRLAMEAMSIEGIMGMVARDYYETSGSIDASDDFGFERLQKKLEKTFSHIKDLRLMIYLQSVKPKDDKLQVVFRFGERALLDLPAGEKWMSLNDTSRITLRQKGQRLEDGFEIVSGL